MNGSQESNSSASWLFIQFILIGQGLHVGVIKGNVNTNWKSLFVLKNYSMYDLDSQNMPLPFREAVQPSTVLDRCSGPVPAKKVKGLSPAHSRP